LLYAISDAIEKGEKPHFLAKIAYIQHTDITTYDSVDFDDPIFTLTYFKKLYIIISSTSEKEVEKMFTRFMLAFKETTEKGSKISAEVQAQHIMRSAAEKVHGALRDLKPNPDSLGTSVSDLTDVILDAMLDLLHLWADCIQKRIDDSKDLPVDSRCEDGCWSFEVLG
jgi:hypothetical protein